uniref:Uncharacterized protein n=2 Tax=Sphaerodactylus townsendi TaxID=933632 RepID=A0ACB8FTC1_9SAUR
MCRHYAENQDDHMEGVLYEYSRRHPELSPQLLNRFGTKYQEMLDKCCKIESTEECVSKEKPDLNKTFADAMEVIRTNCELYASLGDYKFKNALLVRYTKKAPQLSFEKLDQYAEQLRAVAAKCCQLGEDKKLVCAEGYTDLVLGSVCLEHQEHPINSQICQCCSNNYAFRRECFSAIEVDDGYAPAPCAPEMFSFHEDLCTANADAEKRKPRLLVNLVKCKPTITGEQLKAIITDFYGLVGKCCQAENHEQCFQEEGPKLIERAQAALN